MKRIAEALAQVQGQILVTGHTDNQPIKTKEFRNNWYLSTARAISVLEFMVDAGFAAKNVAAAGYGEFDPIAANDTPQNREQNRRIEIILVPNLEELPSLTAPTITSCPPWIICCTCTPSIFASAL